MNTHRSDWCPGDKYFFEQMTENCSKIFHFNLGRKVIPRFSLCSLKLRWQGWHTVHLSQTDLSLPNLPNFNEKLLYETKGLNVHMTNVTSVYFCKSPFKVKLWQLIMEVLPAKDKKKSFYFSYKLNLCHTIYGKAYDKKNLEHPFLKLSSVIRIKEVKWTSGLTCFSCSLKK